MNKRRLLKLADFLDNMGERLGVSHQKARAHFNLDHFVDFDGAQLKNPKWTPLECGSTACAVGWMPAVSPRDWVWDRSGDHAPRLRGTRLCDFDAAEKYFELTWDESFYLFMPSPGYQTAKHVAKRIRSFVTSGGIPK